MSGAPCLWQIGHAAGRTTGTPECHTVALGVTGDEPALDLLATCRGHEPVKHGGLIVEDDCAVRANMVNTLRGREQVPR